jgi:hypothetical protein
MLTLPCCQPIYKYHMNCYKTVNFKFSALSWSWLQSFFEPIITDYQLHAPASNALVKFNDLDYQQFIQSSAWSEIVSFLQTYSIADPYPQLFIYKQLSHVRKIALGNPHIDTTGGDGTEIDIPIRFNILMSGPDDTEMVWWNIDRNDHQITNEKFTNPSGQAVGRLQVVGDTPTARWQTLGEPMVRSNALTKKQEYASFVRTDILHALNWTGASPRLILSVRSNTAWPF